MASATTTSAAAGSTSGLAASTDVATTHATNPQPTSASTTATTTTTATATTTTTANAPLPDKAATSASSAGANSNSSSTSGFKVYGTLFRVDARYQLLNPLGKGSYGVVCAAKDKDTGQSIAIKKVFPMAKRTSDARHTLREILLLQFLGKHPNIVSIHNLLTNVKDDELYIVMDLMDTDMHRVLQSSQALSESHIKYFLHQLLRGVKYLHDNGVLHRDLKPGNLLLTKTCQLKIADFGLARKTPKGSSGMTSGVPISTHERPRSAPVRAAIVCASSSLSGIDSQQQQQHQQQAAPMTEHIVTRWYRAPELMLQPDGLYDKSIDMWSVGCIFAEILGRKALFPGKNFLHQLSLIFEVIGTPSCEAFTKIKSTQAQRFIKSLGKKPKVPFRSIFPNASDDAIDLLDKLLQFDPKDRFTAQEALAHPYLAALERKYKNNEPKPTNRIDFAFEQNRKLTRMDLRAMIIKEVENFRKAESAGSSSSSTELPVTAATPSTLITDKSPMHGSTRPMSAAASLNQVVAQQQLKRLDKHEEDVRIAAAAAAAAVEAAKAHAHATSKTTTPQANSSAQGTGNGNSISTSNVAIHAHVSTVVGAGRSRLRVITKPPVPKQQPVGVETTTSTNVNQVTVESRLMMNNFLMPRLASGNDDTHHAVSNDGFTTSTSQSGTGNGNASANLSEPAPPTGASPASGPSTNEEHQSTQHSQQQQHQQQQYQTGHLTHTKQREQPHEVVQQRQKLTALHGLSPPSQVSSLFPPKASLPARPATANAPIELVRSQNNSRNSPSSSSSSEDEDAEMRRIQETIRARRASTPAAFATANGVMAPRPATAASLTFVTPQFQSLEDKQQQDHATLANPALNPAVHNRKPAPLRRACSAGPGTNARSNKLDNDASATNNEAPQSPTALVGSTSSLIHAQRNNNMMHQSLTKTGELFLKKHLEKGGLTSVHSTNNGNATGSSNGNLPPTKGKRLTVPKSPKFSLMSWQKKQDDPHHSSTYGKKIVIGTDPMTGKKLRR